MKQKNQATLEDVYKRIINNLIAHECNGFEPVHMKGALGILKFSKEIIEIHQKFLTGLTIMKANIAQDPDDIDIIILKCWTALEMTKNLEIKIKKSQDSFTIKPFICNNCSKPFIKSLTDVLFRTNCDDCLKFDHGVQ